MNILVTGADGFIGKNLIAWLKRQETVSVIPFDLGNTLAELDAGLASAEEFRPRPVIRKILQAYSRASAST